MADTNLRFGSEGTDAFFRLGPKKLVKPLQVKLMPGGVKSTGLKRLTLKTEELDCA